MKVRMSISVVLMMLGTLWMNVANAAIQTVTLDVPGMYCEVCPITVKQSLVNLSGVKKVKVSFNAKEAVVTFDDGKVSTKQMMEATANAGYPSTVKSPKGK